MAVRYYTIEEYCRKLDREFPDVKPIVTICNNVNSVTLDIQEWNDYVSR